MTRGCTSLLGRTRHRAAHGGTGDGNGTPAAHTGETRFRRGQHRGCAGLRRPSCAAGPPPSASKLDRALLPTLVEKVEGGPTGLERPAAALGEDKGTLEDLVEPFPLQGGYLDRTPRGRTTTRRAFEHLGMPPPPRAPGGGQGRLFPACPPGLVCQTPATRPQQRRQHQR
jgi:hypothetical protein